MPVNEPSVDQLRDLVSRSSRENPHLTSRLEKAAFLMLLRPIETLGEDHYRVGSEDGLRVYEILNGHCECSDYLRHGSGHPCKHRLALALYQQLGCAGPTLNSGEANSLRAITLKLAPIPGDNQVKTLESGRNLDTD